MIRARLLATRLETDVTVELLNGQKWKGALTDIAEKSFLLLAEPDKETRKRLKLSSGMKLKKNLAIYLHRPYLTNGGCGCRTCQI